jgi:hypothetical protein
MSVPEFLQALARCLGLPELMLNEDGACAVRLVDGLLLDVQVLAVCEEVRWTLPLGRPDPAHLAAVLAEALAANHLMGRKVPRHFAFETERETLVLCETLPLSGLTSEALQQDLDHFLEAGRQTRQQVHEAGRIFPETDPLPR